VDGGARGEIKMSKKRKRSTRKKKGGGGRRKRIPVMYELGL